MRIAHFSDLHVLALEGVSVSRYMNKRLTGVANLALRRAPLDELTGAWHAAAKRIPSRFRKKDAHRTMHVRTVARAVAKTGVDHVVITGDITNLALEPEFEAARAILESELHLAPHDVSIIPGNHDLYTRGALKNGRFGQFFAEYIHSDLDVGADESTGPFPYVKLRGPCAIIGLSSAVPRAPFVAAGEIGRAQLDAFSRALDHAEVKSRLPIVLVHHPIAAPRSRVKQYMESLRDGAELLERLRNVSRGLILHGHLHKRIRAIIPTDAGEIISCGAASASLEHSHEQRMSGFNVYEIDDHTQAITSIEAHVLDPKNDVFHRENVPSVALANYW